MPKQSCAHLFYTGFQARLTFHEKGSTVNDKAAEDREMYGFVVIVP